LGTKQGLSYPIPISLCRCLLPTLAQQQPQPQHQCTTTTTSCVQKDRIDEDQKERTASAGDSRRGGKAAPRRIKRQAIVSRALWPHAYACAAHARVGVGRRSSEVRRAPTFVSVSGAGAARFIPDVAVGESPPVKRAAVQSHAHKRTGKQR